jgi:hypothetical protein
MTEFTLTKRDAGMVVFTDLDGTLLDHETYSCGPPKNHWITRCYADARVTGLNSDFQSEVDAAYISPWGSCMAAESFLTDPLGAPQIPDGNRMVPRIPDIFARLNEAVEIDIT